VYERTMRPPQKVHAPWLEHNRAQARAGLAWLEARAGGEWLALGRLTQADVTAVAMLDFTRIVDADLVAPGTYPRLDALSARCNTLPPFAETQPTAGVDQANPSLPGTIG
jgi:glutathione S-transferase